MDSAQIVHNIFSLYTLVSYLARSQTKGSAYCIDEEAREDSIPETCLWLALFVVIWAINLLKVTYQDV